MELHYGPTLKFDEEFLCLMQPLSDKELSAMKQSLLSNRMAHSIAAWNDTLIDGYERYVFCREAKITYNVHRINFSSRKHAITWICREQLRKSNLPTERFRYLIGKRYETERIPCVGGKQNDEKASEHKKWQNNSSYHTALKLGKEYGISHNTVYKYGLYARHIDIIREKDAEIVQKILNGQLKISHDNIVELSRLPKEHILKLKKTVSEEGLAHVSFSELRHELQWKRICEPRPKPITQEEIPIKQMPKFDPDAEAASLRYTIPSWISSISRIQLTNFSIVSDAAKYRLVEQLCQLDEAINKLLKKIKEEQHG